MQAPIVIAHHLIWTAYGCWLPNDPRGAMSHTIRNDVLAELGDLHYGRKEVQPASADIRLFYAAADERLTHPRMEFLPHEIVRLGAAFSQAIADARYTCYACAIMPDHTHVLIRKHRDQAENMIARLQTAGRLALQKDVTRFAGHPVWGGPGWKVFQDHPDDIRRTVGYINGNPPKLHVPAQHWAFVTPYDGWPFHPGHSPNSPYAKRLRQAGGGG